MTDEGRKMIALAENSAAEVRESLKILSATGATAEMLRALAASSDPQAKQLLADMVEHGFVVPVLDAEPDAEVQDVEAQPDIVDEPEPEPEPDADPIGAMLGTWLASHRDAFTALGVLVEPVAVTEAES